MDHIFPADRACTSNSRKHLHRLWWKWQHHWCALFKLNLPDDWSYNPDDISDYEHSCSVKVFKGTGKDNSENNITIRATKETSYAFRKHLLDSDIDLHDYADGAIEKTIWGDVDYIRITDNFKRTYYIYRHEPSGITYNITLSGEENDSSKNVFNNLDLKLEDTGNFIFVRATHFGKLR